MPQHVQETQPEVATRNLLDLELHLLHFPELSKLNPSERANGAISRALQDVGERGLGRKDRSPRPPQVSNTAEESD